MSIFLIYSVNIVDYVLVAIAGFTASFVDGALGMGFGPTSSSILLGAGLAPGAVSTTVNLAKVATGLTSALAHWRFANIDRRVVRALALPGMAGALIGATVLASVDGDHLRPVVAVLLLVVGLRILLRFSEPSTTQPQEPGLRSPATALAGTKAVAAAGGVTNALIGAWGPVVTPFLLQGGLAPRYAVGSVNTAEVAVAVVAAGSLLASHGSDGVNAATVLAMLGGGAIASPVAARTVRHVPPRLLGLGVATLLLVTNTRELAGWAGIGAGRWALYAAVLVGVALAGIRSKALNRTPDEPLELDTSL